MKRVKALFDAATLWLAESVDPDRCPERILIILAPLFFLMIEGDLRRVPHHLAQRLDGAACASVPIAA